MRERDILNAGETIDGGSLCRQSGIGAGAAPVAIEHSTMAHFAAPFRQGLSLGEGFHVLADVGAKSL